MECFERVSQVSPTGKVGIEPTTFLLTVRRSTTELQAIIGVAGLEPALTNIRSVVLYPSELYSNAVRR